MPSVAPVRVRAHRGKLLLILSGALGFVALGVYLLDVELHAALLAIGFFGACTVVALYRLFDPTSGLVLDQDGFTDRSSGAALGRVEWKDVTELRISTVEGQRFLTVDVADPEKYISRAGPVLSRIARMNLELVKSPIVITPNTLAMDLDGLMALFQRFLDAYRRDSIYR